MNYISTKQIQLEKKDPLDYTTRFDFTRARADVGRSVILGGH